jgi:hypothetical protein
MANGAGGPGGSRVPAGGKVLHRRQKLTPEEEAELRKSAEVAAGLRCGGCGARVSHGFEFVFIDVGKIDGRTFAHYHNLVACSGKTTDCDFAAICAEGAAAMKEVKQRFIDTPEMQKLMTGIVGEKKPEPEPEEAKT